MNKLFSRSWSILLQSVARASRSLFISLLILASGFSTLPLAALPPLLNEGSHLVILPTGEKVLEWHGKLDRTYFLQVSDSDSPLAKWKWAPLIEKGNDENISHEVITTAKKGFFRLQYTDQTATDLEAADFDNDGLTNLAEITPVVIGSTTTQTNPLDPDTDHDGLPDKWERDHGFDPTDDGSTNPVNGPNGDADGDGVSNKQEEIDGSNPNNKHSDTDGVPDGEDADPNDAEINWKKIPESRYVWVEQVTGPHTPIAVNRQGMILFKNFTIPSGENPNLENAVWSSTAHQWVPLAVHGNSQLISNDVDKLTGINDSGTIVGLSKEGSHVWAGMVWKPSTTTPGQYEKPSYFMPAETWSDGVGYPISISGVDAVGGIAHDGTVNVETMINHDYDPYWDVARASYDTNSSSQNTEPIEDIIPWEYYTVPGAVLDNGRGLFFDQWFLESNLPDPWKLMLQDAGAVTEVPGIFASGLEVRITGSSLNLAPTPKSTGQERLWLAVAYDEYANSSTNPEYLATKSQVRLEKLAGGTGADRWHKPPSMNLGADFVHPSGIAIIRKQTFNFGTPQTFPPKLWRNGKYSTLGNHVVKPSDLEITDVIDIASNGIILATAKVGEVNKTGLIFPPEFILDNNNIAYKPDSEALGVSNYVTDNELPATSQFGATNLDPENFRLQAIVLDSTTTSVEMKFEVSRNGAVVSNTNYTLDKKEGNFLRGEFLRLVTDSEDDAVSGNQTILVKLGDKIKVSYEIADTTLEQEIQVGRPSVENNNEADQPRKHDIRTVKLAFHVFKNAAGAPCVTSAQIDQMVNDANERLAQAGIIAEPTKDFGSGDTGFDRPQPIQNGFDASDPANLEISFPNADEEACVNFKDGDANTIDIMVVESINGGVRATTYHKSRNTTDEAKYNNWIVLSSVVPGNLPNTLPHEVMHLLLNKFHRPDPDTALFHENTSPNKNVSGTKRIGPYPDAASATYTPLPGLTITGVGQDDTTKMRATAETLP